MNQHMVAVSAALLSVFFVGSQSLRAQEGSAQAVSTVAAERQPIANSIEFVGRVQAPEKVDIRAQVKGILQEVLFQDGADADIGKPLYQIDKSLFQAAVDQAEGELERSKAGLALASVQRERAEELLARNAGTVVARDQAVAVEDQSKAAVTAAQANL